MATQVDLGQAMKNFQDHFSTEERETIIQAIAQGLTAIQAPSNVVNTVSQEDANHGGVQRNVTTGGSRAARRRELKKAYREMKKNPSRDRNMKTLKPLNSFMIYRAYVSAVLDGVPQKEKSKHISVLWKTESNKGLWGVLGKAYSEIRDHTKFEERETLTTDKFLAAAAPFTGLPAASAYLEDAGWKVVSTGTEKSLERTVPSAAGIVKGTKPILTSAMSVRDIVEHCYDTGLAPRPAPGPARHQPDSGKTIAISYVALPNSVDAAPGDAQIVTEEQVVSNEDHVETENDTVAENTNLPLRHDEVFIEQQNALAASGDQFPYNMQFHPGVIQPSLGLDFEMIQNSFDAFDVGTPLDMDEWVDFQDGFAF